MKQPHAQPATAAKIYERLERRDATRVKIIEVKDAIGPTSAKLSDLDQKCRAAYAEQKRMERDLDKAKQEGRADNAATLEARLDVLKGQIQAMEDRTEDVQRERHRLATELDQLEREELPACRQATTSEEVLAHQAAIADLEREAAGLDEAIQGRRRLIQEIRDQLPALAERNAERCELLALLAINQATQAQVEELDAKIAAENLEHERVRGQSQVAIDQAEQTIAGLQRMHDGIAAKIADLKALSPLVMEQYLRSEMDTLATAYVEKARALKELFIQLYGAEMLLYSVMGQAPELLGSQELMIPGFNLKACHDVPRGGTSNFRYMFRSEIEGQRATAWQKAMASQRARLRGMGIDLI